MLAAVLPERIAEDAGVDAATIRAIAGKLVDVRPAVVCATLGAADDLAGTGAAVVKLQSLLDDLAGARSVSLPLGAGNVQGLVAMGVAPDVLPGGDLVADAEARQRLADAWGVASLPAEPGRSTAEIVAALERRLRCTTAWVWANEAASFGDADDLLAALGKAATSSSSRAPCAATSPRLADVVLPAVAWGEEDGTFTNAERRISRLRRVQRPPGAARPGWWAFREVAKRLGHEWQAGYPKAVWEDEISLLIPSLGGVTYAELDEYGLCWPAPGAGHRLTLTPPYRTRLTRATARPCGSRRPRRCASAPLCVVRASTVGARQRAGRHDCTVHPRAKEPCHAVQSRHQARPGPDPGDRVARAGPRGRRSSRSPVIRWTRRRSTAARSTDQGLEDKLGVALVAVRLA